MSKRLLNLNTITESIFGIQQYQSQNNLQMDTEYRQMLKVLTKAMQGETLYKILCTQQKKYGVRYLFCDKEDTGRRIIEILRDGL